MPWPWLDNIWRPGLADQGQHLAPSNSTSPEVDEAAIVTRATIAAEAASVAKADVAAIVAKALVTRQSKLVVSSGADVEPLANKQ